MKKKRRFLSDFPEISKYYNPDLNDGVQADELPFQSAKKVIWQCENKHTWGRSVANMVNTFRKCQYCADKMLWPGENDFATKCPEFVDEWDRDKNELGPEDYWWKSTKKVHWKCRHGHEWEASPRSRLGSGAICPMCKPTKGTSFSEQVLYYFCSERHPDAQNRPKLMIGEEKLEADIYIPPENVIIEYNGQYFHQDKKEKDYIPPKSGPKKYKRGLVN